MKKIFILAGVCAVLPLHAQQTRDANFEVARLRASLQQVIQEHERIVGLLEQNRQVTEAIINRLQAVEKVAAANSVQTRSGMVTKADIQELQRQIVVERQARERAIGELIKSISGEIARVSSAPSGGTGARPGQGVYTVVAGDTLSTIAQAFGVTVKALKTANNLSDDIIRVDQKLNIPAQ